MIRDHKLPVVFDSPFLEVSLHVGLDGGDLHDDPLLLAVAHVHQLLRRRLWKSNWKSKMAIYVFKFYDNHFGS